MYSNNYNQKTLINLFYPFQLFDTLINLIYKVIYYIP